MTPLNPYDDRAKKARTERLRERVREAAAYANNSDRLPCPGFRGECVNDIPKPKRGPAPKLCDECKKTKDADRKRTERAAESQSKNAGKYLKPRAPEGLDEEGLPLYKKDTPSHRHRVPGIYRNKRTGAELRWKQADDDRIYGRAGFEGTRLVGGVENYLRGRASWRQTVGDCIKAADDWEAKRAGEFAKHPDKARNYYELTAKLQGKSLDEQAAIIEAHVQGRRRSKVVELKRHILGTPDAQRTAA